MSIRYDMDKALPSDQLRRLFIRVGWSDGLEDETMQANFNLPFLHSTLVVSAWEGEQLIGTVRVLSDLVIRSEVYDLAVDPAYQGRGIGRELIRRCMDRLPDTEWFLRTTEDAAGFYERLGFTPEKGVFLSIPSKYTNV